MTPALPGLIASTVLRVSLGPARNGLACRQLTRLSRDNHQPGLGRPLPKATSMVAIVQQVRSAAESRLMPPAGTLESAGPSQDMFDAGRALMGVLAEANTASPPDGPVHADDVALDNAACVSRAAAELACARIRERSGASWLTDRSRTVGRARYVSSLSGSSGRPRTTGS